MDRTESLKRTATLGILLLGAGAYKLMATTIYCDDDPYHKGYAQAWCSAYYSSSLVPDHEACVYIPEDQALSFYCTDNPGREIVVWCS